MSDRFTCIAVDMGAGSIRLMLGTLDGGKLSCEEAYRISNETVEIDGHERWDIERIFAEIRKGIARAIALAEDAPESIGVDSWGVDFVMLDEEGKLLELPVAYRDSRTEGMMDQWRTMMGDAETYARSGINFYVFNTLFQLLSLRGAGLLDASASLLFIPAYINYLLTGKVANELSSSSTSQMLGVLGRQWDEAILGHLNLDPAKLGEVVDAGTRLGPVVLPEVRETKMEGVAVCGHDTACAVAAIPVETPDFAYISTGTWCIVGIESDTPLLSKEALELGLTNERGYGNSYRILKNIVGLWLLRGLKKALPDGTSFSEMEAMTLEAGHVGQVIDPDAALFYNPDDMKAAFDAYFEQSGQSIPERFGAYLCCAYDSLCFSFRYHVEELERLSGKPIRRLHLIGGGSQSDYLNQRIATICRRKVVSGPVEGAALGNMLIQGIAMGRIDSLETGRQLVRQSCKLKTYLPGKDDSQNQARFEHFLTLKLHSNKS